ncbi:cytochrome (ubi)quinol oxidase subunit III [Dyella soli]|nr:cytochrome (ubi)quinol oxidase subunit III [Dyella soli]
MSAEALTLDASLSDDDSGSPTRQHVTAFGFYIYLLSDGILFATLFAAFAVLRNATDGGPDAHELFGSRNALIETIVLLSSTLTCGLAMLAADGRKGFLAVAGFLATAVLGVTFLSLELHEFADLITRGAGPDRSAFLSSFFTLVSAHGMHVAVGLLWLGILIVQLLGRGFTPAMMRRLLCFSLFWHVLDVVWIGVFTFVYLIGGNL